MGWRRLTDLLLDTHVWIWSIVSRTRTQPSIRALIDSAASPLLSVSSLYEVAYKARLGKWPEVLSFSGRLAELASEQGVHIVNIDAEIAVRAAQLDWAHRDPFDRLIAATAITRGATLISADAQFDDLDSRPDWPGRLW